MHGDHAFIEVMAAFVLTLGGAVSTNIHGRGLLWRPFIQDIESITLVDAEAKVRNISRTQEPELFSLAVGGYGLFGVITEVELRLRPRLKLERDSLRRSLRSGHIWQDSATKA